MLAPLRMSGIFARSGEGGKVPETTIQTPELDHAGKCLDLRPPAILDESPFPAPFPHSLMASNRLDSLDFSGGAGMLE
jgi:hypothetical protein